jgi:hypothetical protein
MRGSARSVSGSPSPAAHRASWQGDNLSPVHPLDQEAALPLVGSPASEGWPCDTICRTLRAGARFGQEHCAPETRIHAERRGAWLPETPAPKGAQPLSALSPMRRRRSL